MKLQHEPIPSDKFTYDRTTRTFSAEASDFPNHAPFQRLYDDAVDVGFTMKSTKTGAEVVYTMEQVHRDGEGETTHWTFVPTRESYNRHREAVNTKVVVFND